ncbi:ArsC family reductase [Paenochrobactrum glaciei]|uniref:ArsC family reductase n=1 Tax=Paenochrobactrum glaciei TaxID=486407 RepID=A0ABP3QKQ6_9HYPH
MSVTIYGIKSCDTMRKAFNWLESAGIDYKFHDYKKEGLAQADLEQWAGKAGWEKLLNRAGTTFRKLPEEDRADLNEQKAISLMLAQPSMVKRPVLMKDGQIIVGFKPELYEEFFK